MRRSLRQRTLKTDPTKEDALVQDEDEANEILGEPDEEDDDDDDDDGDDDDGQAKGFFFDGVNYTTYQEMVNAKRKRNQQVLMNSGLLASAAALKSTVSKPPPTKKGIKKRKSTESQDGAVYRRRKSSRIAGIESDGLFVEEERSGKFTVAATNGTTVPASGTAQANNVREIEPEFYRNRINDGSVLSIKEAIELAGSKWVKENSVSEAISFVRDSLSLAPAGSLAKKVSKGKSPVSVTETSNESMDETVARMKTMTVSSDAVVAKIVPDRIYGIAAHPSPSALIVAAGDKTGYVGIWNVDSRAKDNDDTGNDGVHLFRFHKGSACCVQWTALGDTLFSASYDGTVRLFDVASESFEQVFATYDSQAEFKGELGYSMDTGYRYWTQYACLDHRSSDKSFFLSTSAGTAMHVDMRSKRKITFHEDLSEKKINTLSLHPNGYSLASAGLDGTVNIWDLRKFGNNRASAHSRAPQAVASYSGGRSVNSAFFSPSGHALLATTMGDKLDLFEDAHLSAKKNILKPTHSIKHNNQTGRWLTTLMAQWHPSVDLFAVGCLKQPRRIELMDSKGKTVQELQGDLLTAVASRCCFHPSTDQTIVVGGNSSGRVTVFRS